MKTEKTVYIKMSVELLQVVRQMAVDGDRSVNAQIVRMLKRAVEQEQASK